MPFRGSVGLRGRQGGLGAWSEATSLPAERIVPEWSASGAVEKGHRTTLARRLVAATASAARPTVSRSTGGCPGSGSRPEGRITERHAITGRFAQSSASEG